MLNPAEGPIAVMKVAARRCCRRPDAINPASSLRRDEGPVLPERHKPPSTGPHRRHCGSALSFVYLLARGSSLLRRR